MQKYSCKKLQDVIQITNNSNMSNFDNLYYTAVIRI